MSIYFSVSEDEVTEESDIMDSTDMQLEIVTECWVEPQAGVVSQCDPERHFFQGLDFTSLAESVSYYCYFFFSYSFINLFRNYDSAFITTPCVAMWHF